MNELSVGSLRLFRALCATIVLLPDGPFWSIIVTVNKSTGIIELERGFIAEGRQYVLLLFDQRIHGVRWIHANPKATYLTIVRMKVATDNAARRGSLY